MLALLPLAVSLIFVYLFMWLSVLATDDGLDAHESGLGIVAARQPFREGPPANMAKLILLRHKIQTTNRKRRSPSQARLPSRVYTIPQSRQQSPWLRFGKAFGGKQYH